ncbi:MAG: cation transporter [Gemmatimonadetes bacterium]|nr:cation transporter [Gemmatimonadota bacterium]MYI06474.1 cation transporter [Gemmatimonadota bacterium]
MTSNRAVWLWAILVAIWLLLSEQTQHLETLFIVFGLITCTVAVGVCVRMGVVDRESVPVHLAGRAVLYTPWLIWEVFKSNLRVARIILAPRVRVDPSIVHFHASQRTDLGRFIYANSITLTPGTVTTGIVADDLEVHAIVQTEIDGSEENDMNRRVTALEGERAG